MRSILLCIDLTDAPRRLTHVVADFPVQPNTTASFTTPLWLPALHMPDGPVGQIVNLFFTVGHGRIVLKWRRDTTQAHIYHVEIPSGETTVRATFDAILKSDVTRRMAMVQFEATMMHSAYLPVSRIPVQATLRILPGWNYATSLTVASEGVARNGTHKVMFEPVTAERLADSPVLIGRYLSQSNITKDGRHQLCVAVSEPELTKIPQDRLDKLERLIAEAAAVFGPGPYQQYKFLSLSSDVLMPGDNRAGGSGMEHAECTHLVTSGKAFVDDEIFDWVSQILSHEYVHLWNGKYRRPVGHVPDDFTTPLDGTLLWVYEGLTQYYGFVLAARSGLSKRSTVQTAFASAIADMQSQTGRGWRSTEDTGTGVALQMRTAGLWNNLLRGTDYYSEGILFWLDVDTLIREKSRGVKTLDHFCRKFFDAGGATQPLVIAYTLDEVISTLNETWPCNWAEFIRTRVQTPQAQVNTEGFERAGYQFTYTTEPIRSPVPNIHRRRAMWYSLGVRVGKEDTGTISDVRRFSKADAAGIAPSQTITHVGGEKYSFDKLAAAVEATCGQAGGQVHLRLVGDEESWDVDIEHSQGLVYPTLELCDKPDILTDIFTARTTS